MRLRLGIALLLVGLTFAVFAQVRQHRFVDFDDLSGIVENPALEVASVGEALRVAFTTDLVFNRIPLTVLSLRLDRALYGTEPAGFLLTNVALHALATLLLFFALERMTRAVWRSAFVAAVFAVHPLHVESVAWASQRKDVLAGLFWMAALLAHARFAERPGSAGRYGLVVACLALALLSKPSAVTLPFALLLLDAWPLRRLGRRALLEKLPMLVLAAAAAAVTFAVQHAAGAMAVGERIPFGWRLANALDSCVAYLGDSLWPHGLAPFYPHPADSLGLARVAGAALLLAAITLLAVRSARRRPYLLVGWLWFLGTLVPMLGLVQVGMQARADRYTYLPLVGLAIALAWGAADLAGRARGARAALGAAGAAAVAALALTAHAQVAHWRDTLALFRHAAAVTEGNYFAHFGVANGLRREGRLAEAVVEYRRALELRPRWSRAANNLAWVLATAPDPSLRDPAEAIRLGEELARRNPPDPNHLDTLAAAYAAGGRFDDAVRTAERAARAADGAGLAAVARAARANVSRYRAGRRVVDPGSSALRWEPAPAPR